MKFDELLRIVGREPVFETGLLLSGDVDANDVRRQLSRWTGSGRLIRLRRSLYALAAPYRKTTPHPFVIANHLVRPSYVSLQSVLALHGLIPESVPVTTSVTTGRPSSFSTPLGDFVFRHVRVPLFQGYRTEDLDADQQAFIASPEKALLDLLYLERGSDSPAFLAELRLDLVDNLDLDTLGRMAERTGKAKVQRAVSRLIERTETESVGWQRIEIA